MPETHLSKIITMKNSIELKKEQIQLIQLGKLKSS